MSEEQKDKLDSLNELSEKDVKKFRKWQKQQKIQKAKDLRRNAIIYILASKSVDAGNTVSDSEVDNYITGKTPRQRMTWEDYVV